MSSDEYYSDESSGFSMGEEIHRRANRKQYGSSGPGSRDVGTQMKTHYILEPQRYFSKVRDVGTQTIENANRVIRNPRILSNSYTEAIRVKKEEKEFSFVYDRRKDELYRIRIISESEKRSDEDNSSTSSTESNDSRSDDSSGFSHSIDEIDDELGNKRTVGVQMSTKYLVQESRPKVVLRDVAIQTKLANVYGPSQSKMIEQLWRNKIPLSKNVTCSLPTSWRQGSDISTSNMSYTSDSHHRTRRKSIPSNRKRDTTHRQPGSAWYFQNSYDVDRGTSTTVREGKQQNANTSMLNSGGTKLSTGVVSKTEKNADTKSAHGRKCKSKRGSSKGHRRHSSGRSSVTSTTSSVSSRSGRSDRKAGKREENFQLTSFEYLGNHSSVRLKSEISSISTQTDTERKGPKVFRDPSRKLVCEQQSRDCPPRTIVAGLPEHQPSDSETGIELTYSPPQPAQEKVNLYTRDHSPTPVEQVVSCGYPYRPTENPIYLDKVIMQENDNLLDRSSQNSDRDKDYRSCSVEIGQEPNVLPAEFIEKPVINPRVRKRKPPPPPNVAIRVGGGWMKEEHHRIQHRPLHRNFMATSDRIPFVRSQFHHNPLKIPVVNKERKHTDKMRYASFIP